MKQSGIKVSAPASLSNLAVGFDILGLALDITCDEVIAWKTDKPGVHLVGVYGDKGQTSREAEGNAASLAARHLVQMLGESNFGLAMELHKKIPVGSGLGGSAASAVAGVMAANELLGRPLERRDLLTIAMEAESIVSGGWYADNVCASLLGGLILLRDNQSLDVHRIPLPKGIYITVVLPQMTLTTKESRIKLSTQYTLSQLVEQTGNLAGFIQGLWQSDFDLIGRSLRDVCIEPQRAMMIPGFFEMQQAALDAGSLGCSISGSGPAVFALSANSIIAEEAGAAMQKAIKQHRCDSILFIGQPNLAGAIRC